MDSDNCILKEDCYISIETEATRLIHHPNLNVLLVFSPKNDVKVLDVHSGCILQSCNLSENDTPILGQYMPLQEKILVWDEKKIGYRGDYNGVLLLDTILQTPVAHNEDIVRLEMPMSEALLFQQTIESLEEHGVELSNEVSNELIEKLKCAQSSSKRGIKAQRWNTVCFELPYSSIKLVADSVVTNLKRLEYHIPALAIASALNERLTDLLSGSRMINASNSGTFHKFLMYSEAARRQTFEKWPHMDYKWALPDQMAQAGFYHQPSLTGEDRAMCFTCNVCLVCWEKTDEPWSEHERHSATCPYIKGEYTQNVPLSITYATSPAVKTDGFKLISTNDKSHVLCTSNSEDDIHIWGIERQLQKLNSFHITKLITEALYEYGKDYDKKFNSLKITAMCILSNNRNKKIINKLSSFSLKANILGTTIICGISIKLNNDENMNFIASFLIENKECMESDDNCLEKTQFGSDNISKNMIMKETCFESDYIKMSDFYTWKIDDIEKNEFSTLIDDEDDSVKLENQSTKLIGNMDKILASDDVKSEITEDIICDMGKLDNIELILKQFFEINGEKDEIIKNFNLCNKEKNLLVHLLDINNENSKLKLFTINDDNNILQIEICSRSFSQPKIPKDICFLTSIDNNYKKFNNDGKEYLIASIIYLNGCLDLIDVNSLKTISTIDMPNEIFCTAVYCKTLDRLCVCTKSGSLIFYSFQGKDVDFLEEMVDDDCMQIENTDNCIYKDTIDIPDTSKNSLNSTNTLNNSINIENGIVILAQKKDMTLLDLKILYSLTLFDEILTSYVAEVPNCWNELVQAQKQRRNPQQLRAGDDNHFIKTWRLHNDATTWDEHLIEITLAKSTNLGHIDLKFSLYQLCPSPPAIQVTLLKQNTSGFGYRMKPSHSINIGEISESDETADVYLNENEGLNQNPVLSEEYLQTHNAEILAGPIDLSKCMDLSEQGGQITLTSPKLFKTRSRNFLLHIKTMVDPTKEVQGKKRGCDWLHEISITVRGTKNDLNIPIDRIQRIAMLESNNFLENLLKIVCEESSLLKKNISLDILIWTYKIRLVRFRSPKSMKKTQNKSTNTTKNSSSDNSSNYFIQQVECIEIFEKKIVDLISTCIINGNRTISHKCVKLILILNEGVRNLPSNQQIKEKFTSSLTNAILTCLPKLFKAKTSSSIRWLPILVCATSTKNSHTIISEACIGVLFEVLKEIKKRPNDYYDLLNSRFGLNGFPFESELFDIELPVYNKNYSSPNTLANIIKTNVGLIPSVSSDIRKISSIDGVDFRSLPHVIKQRSISNQIRGLLEVQPLHFTCCAASEATKVENIDSVISNANSAVNVDDMMVATPNYQVENQIDSKKDVDKDNINDEVIINVKNLLADKIIFTDFMKHIPKDDESEIKSNGTVEYVEIPSFVKPLHHSIEKCIMDNSKLEFSTQETDNFEKNIYSVPLPWHKILNPPSKQMIVIDRIHSGARRYVVIDFGMPIILTDLVIPACDELASLFLDIWCIDEETDCTRLASVSDISTKTLVLSDLQPIPICRYIKITIIGRYGMSTTRCRIPIGSFYGHMVVTGNDGCPDAFVDFLAASPSNINTQLKSLTALYENIHCRFSLSTSKLEELLQPILNSDITNFAHMEAFIENEKEENMNNKRIISTYEDCIRLQYQLNLIRNITKRLESSLDNKIEHNSCQNISSVSRDKLRVLSESLIEILLHFSIEYGVQNSFALQTLFDAEGAKLIFNVLVIYGEAHVQLAASSYLVKMCGFQSWWGDFLSNIFYEFYSSQNSRIFPQDRVFYLLTYLGRKSIAMGTCRTVVVDAVLKTLAKLLVPLSSGSILNDNTHNSSLWSKTDLQLITWLLLFLSVCLDDGTNKKDKSASRWDFMSCEADFTKARSTWNCSGKSVPRCFKKRIIHQNKYGGLPFFSYYYSGGKKIPLSENDFPGIFEDVTMKPKPRLPKSYLIKSPKNNDVENSFDRGLKSIKLNNILVVARGLVALILEMDYTCNMDLFLLSCKIIGRLVTACRPSIQLPKVLTTYQLEQLIRLAVWNDQQQPWAVHSITCLLQDLLNSDKNYKEPFEVASFNEIEPMEGVIETEETATEAINTEAPKTINNISILKDISYADAVKYGQLPSLIECLDADVDEFLADIDIIDQSKTITKKDSIFKRSSFNFFCKSISNAFDARLEFGININIEIAIISLTKLSSFYLYASLPQIDTNEAINTIIELPTWPDYILNAWSGQEYNSTMQTYQMFKEVFDSIFSDLHLEGTWVHLEQVLQMWLTLNSELLEKPFYSGLSTSDTPKIPFGYKAVKGLLLALAWHCDIKIRTWCLGFQCLILACNFHSNIEKENNELHKQKIGDIIIQNENFEKMLLRFFSGYGMNFTTSNRCVGPTICKYLHDLFLWLQMKAEFADQSKNSKTKLKETLLKITLQLIQPGGAISNKQGPLDAQNQLIRDLTFIQYEKSDLSIAMNIIESVSFLLYNNVLNNEKVQCPKNNDNFNSKNALGNMLATVLGADSTKQSITISDNLLLVTLLKLSASLIQTEFLKENDEMDCNINERNESQTDEIKAEQQNVSDNRYNGSLVADAVLKNFPTMKRFLGTLSNFHSSLFYSLATNALHYFNIVDTNSSGNEPQTVPDGVFHLLGLLSKRASQNILVISPLYQYLELNSSLRNTLPRLQLSEPFLWYVSKILETPAAVSIFVEMGGLKIICQNVIKCNRVLINMEPGLVSLIMQHMTKNTKIKFSSGNSTLANCKKSSNNYQKLPDGLINFAPFCNISSENATVQPADKLIQIASHRRARTPPWNYMFYPNESYVDLTITLPTAILLNEIQLHPHLQTLASCPSAVGIEISKDSSLGAIPIHEAFSTVGMTCIRLKLSKPEIATNIILRLYRPKDCSSIGLTQITILGTTVFSNLFGQSVNESEFPFSDDDSFAKTSVGWIKILSRCFNVATFNSESQLSKKVITSVSAYPGFLEACCTLMNVLHPNSNGSLQNLETVLLKIGSYNKELSYSLIKNLIWNATPQSERFSNEAVCDLLYELCIRKDDFIVERINVLFDWLLKLYHHFKGKYPKCTNPQSGIIKCMASILWQAHEDNLCKNLQDYITNEIFESCFYWIKTLSRNEPLKKAFDSLMCSFCFIKPGLYTNLIKRLGFISLNETQNSGGMTDDIKEANCNTNEGLKESALKNLEILLKPNYLETLAIVCQSSQAIDELLNSGLPKLLVQAIYSFCCSMLSEINQIFDDNVQITRNTCLTDADKVESYEMKNTSHNSFISAHSISDILNFITECCAEGHFRDWLGSYNASIFWKPLLELLCNCRPLKTNEEPMQKAFILIEKSTLMFFSRLIACHPKNQEMLTEILISVINQPLIETNQQTNKTIISGFTRRVVLQLLLECERILISIKSDLPLKKNDHYFLFTSNHPAKRISAYHILLYVTSQTKCKDILQSRKAALLENMFRTMPYEDYLIELTKTGANRIQNDIQKDVFTFGKAFNKKDLKMDMELSNNGMEFLSVVAGVTAKDKRLKDVKNQAAALKDKEISSNFNSNLKKISDPKYIISTEPYSENNDLKFIHPVYPEICITKETTISQILAALHSKGMSLSTPCLSLKIISTNDVEPIKSTVLNAASIEPLLTPLQTFSNQGGLSLLAKYLPTVYPENTKTLTSQKEKEKNSSVNEWVKVESFEEIYEELEETYEPKRQTFTSVPQHSLAAFGLFLRLPAYSDVLLRDKLKAQYLLRLVLGVTGDGEGNDIYSLSVAPSLPTLPFEIFRQLLDSSPLTTDDGLILRRMIIEVGAMHLVLNCLSIFTHQSKSCPVLGSQNDTNNPGVKNLPNIEENNISDDKSHVYWAKGTGFGTGSTQQSWDVEQALLRQKNEEEHVTVLFQVLSSYINPGDKIPSGFQCDNLITYNEMTDITGDLPQVFVKLLEESCLIQALSSYLRNDSVLDITRHVPLYRSILQLLRAIAISNQLSNLLHPRETTESTLSIATLILNMKKCVDTYAKRLKFNKKSNIKGQTQKVTVNLDDGDDEGLALLIPDIQETSAIVQKAVSIDLHNSSGHESETSIPEKYLTSSIEQRYLEVMKKLQFDTFEMIAESDHGFTFVVSHFFENNVRMAGDRGHPSRVKRLAQETVTLSTSLPLSYSSSVFVRCDTDRLDIMKVLITGPAETPYANGCFEFDVYFPPEYPNSPMLINLETTGRHSVRFNPNLYNDGKVCLSVLNTWHGRPEEKWNAQTSSFLQVLVSIQSLILVPEPYFNEPGFERSRGTPSGTHCSKEYNSNIYQACIRWAMLEQIRNPNPCFKEVIHTHFWIKRHEICKQIEGWIAELHKPQFSERSGRTISFNSMVLKRQYRHLREELAKLPVPEGLEDINEPFNPSTGYIPETSTQVTPNSSQNELSPKHSEMNIIAIESLPSNELADETIEL